MKVRHRFASIYTGSSAIYGSGGDMYAICSADVHVCSAMFTAAGAFTGAVLTTTRLWVMHRCSACIPGRSAAVCGCSTGVYGVNTGMFGGNALISRCTARIDAGSADQFAAWSRGLWRGTERCWSGRSTG